MHHSRILEYLHRLLVTVRDYFVNHSRSREKLDQMLALLQDVMQLESDVEL
jgi:hypothetical protein